MLTKLKKYDVNLYDLIKLAHRCEYVKINNNKEENELLKPRLYFTKAQWGFIVVSLLCLFLFPEGLNPDFAGYIISGMSLFAGILFTLVVFLFDKFKSTNFEIFKYQNNSTQYPLGARLKNFYKKTIILSLYVSILTIVCVLLLAPALLSDSMCTPIRIQELIENYNSYSLGFYIKTVILLIYRWALFYFMFDFLYITKEIITSFYDYIIYEINQVHLK